MIQMNFQNGNRFTKIENIFMVAKGDKLGIWD